MTLPGNGIFVVRGEMSTLMTAMRRGSRWNSPAYLEEDQDGLMKQFVELKQILNQIGDLRLIDPNVFLGPFLEVIKTEDTTGTITSLALSAVNKFLCYGLVDPTHPALAPTVQNIATVVTHAKFMGTDSVSDGVALLRVVEVLRTLMCNPEGNVLTNENVCEVMLSCFKICFEPRLNELLRKSAEQALKDMVLLLFMRLPQFSKGRHSSNYSTKLKMVTSPAKPPSKKRKGRSSFSKTFDTKPSNQKVNLLKTEEKPKVTESSQVNVPPSKTPPLPISAVMPVPSGNIVDMQGVISQTLTTAVVEENSVEDDVEKLINPDDTSANEADVEDELNNESASDETKSVDKDSEYVNAVGVRFTHQDSEETENANAHQPYGLPCIQELFRFLIMLCNPLEKDNNDTTMHISLNLLTVALEVGATSIGKYENLLEQVKDDMCRNLFALLNTERLSIFAADLQVCFLLFESLRSHLKFHLEFYLTKLSEIVASENPRIPYEMRELALDNLFQLMRLPGFVAELYINYDCNLYCSDLFENLTKLLSKNTLSATNAFYSTHMLSIDILVSILENIEKHCLVAKTENTPKLEMEVVPNVEEVANDSTAEKITIESDTNNGNDSPGFEHITTFIGDIVGNKSISISKEQLMDLKNKKRVITQGTELFNQRPEKGIQLLQENGFLNSTLDPKEVAHFLRENPGLDKKMIGEYISKKKNVEANILENFVRSFDFSNLRIDQALRLYLESFRLPGEAPLIFLVMEHFADHWHKCNNEPFANTDAAFRLAYAIIMLNMDQHNHNAKRLNVPMTSEDFLKNLRGLNGNQDFDQEMLQKVFESIKNEEIVMPAEQTGIVRENYLWKVLLRRGGGKDGFYHQVRDTNHDKDLFNIIWGPTLSALSYVFDKSNENGYQKSLAGFKKCAGITAYYSLHKDFDALILTLCKFTSLLNILPEANEISVSVAFGTNTRAQAAMKTVFAMVHEYGDCMRESWKNILEITIQLFRLSLLPKTLMEVEDFCEESGKSVLILEKPSQKSEPSLLSSLYSYLASDGQRQPTYEEQEIIKISKKCIRECQIDQIISESKFLQQESLQELIKSILNLINPPTSHKSVGIPYSEDIAVFLMELLVRIVIQNRDRMMPLWTVCRDKIYAFLIGGASCGYDYLLNRTTIALLKLAIYLMRNEELCPTVLQSLKVLLTLKPNVIFRISKQVSVGIYELLKTSAQNIHTENDWQIIFTLLECVGAGAMPPEFDDTPPTIGTKSDGALSSEEDSGLPDRGYISDSEVVTNKSGPNSPTNVPYTSPNGENWIIVNKDVEVTASSTVPQSPTKSTLVYSRKLYEHSPFALMKCWESLGFIVRNAAHITPYSLDSCVRCIRTFVEVCLHGDKKGRKRSVSSKQNPRKKTKDTSKGKKIDNSSDSEDNELIEQYNTFATQLLYLMYTLYTRIGKIFQWWADEGYAVPLWSQGWCPLLQGIARLAVDRRREVRISAIQYLQSALMKHDLDTLSGPEWASCFNQVLFPLLSELLSEKLIANLEPNLLEESRIRTATIMSKVFLYHLTPLISLPSFSEIWLEILDFIEKYMKVGSDMLYDAMLESLKNMLLVMHSIRVFHYNDGMTHSPLWDLTWKRIEVFLPKLKEELFKEENAGKAEDGNHVMPPSHFAVQAQLGPVISENNHNQNVITSLAEDKPFTVGMAIPISQAPVDVASSPRSSIILQPPEDTTQHSNNFSYSTVQQNMPLIIPPNMLPNQSDNVTLSGTAAFASQPKTSPLHQQLPMSSACQPTNILYAASLDKTLPDIVNSSTIQTQNTTVQNESPKIQMTNPAVYQMKNNAEFSNVIELPDMPSQLPASSSVSDASPAISTLQSDASPFGNYQNNQFVPQEAPSANDIESQSPRVPMSHLLAGNAYPSLGKNPPPGIVQSFSPVYIQPQHLVPVGRDIYSDYVQNPYNLTLNTPNYPMQVGGNVATIANDENHSNNPPQPPIPIPIPIPGHVENTSPNKTMSVSNMFQSANYFGGVDESVIPPGSEMLFGQP